MPTATATRARAKVRKEESVVEALMPSPLGSQIDKMFDLREKKRELEAQIALLDAEYREVEERVLLQMEEQKASGFKGSKASASITHTVVGSVEDWDKLNAYVKKTGHFHLFQRRLADAAYRELMEQGKKVPGVVPFTKKRLNLRAVS